MKCEYNVLQYKGYENFKCIGSECRYNCCQNWDITIDESTYKKYKLSSYFTNEMLEKNFTKNKDGNIKFRLEESKKCPLQNKSGLCDIHSNLGEKFLCKTCRVYPRMVNLVDNTLEKKLTTSCPAVIEMFLLNKEQLSFDSVISEEDKEELAIDKKISTIKKDYLSSFWDIRMFTIGLLQNRNFDIEKRLIILGMVYNKLNEVIKENKLDAIKGILDLYSNNLNDVSLFDSLDNLNVNYKMKAVVLKTLRFGIINDNLKKVNENLLELLQFDENGVSEKYNNAIDSKLKPFMEEYDYAFENYLVNIAYSSAMPFDDKGEIMNSYLYLAIQYAMLKAYLVSVDNEKITSEDFVDIITLTSRTLNHNKTYEANVKKVMNGFSTGSLNMLAKIVTLIK